ncbi:precorrin-6Y C5,15-methyltransferase (decarboxylating) subunit CbiT [Alkalibacter rhizosphaerae]|uniref:Precorrin-6Y C5,15-methyltransferase (Decarboxylating) subunit CbiT n=1 Tax=Alkalibacter rhizosphaerae TaxID=2815577 RepID=A0A974XFC2_9FIRM|nr:precorrin-6Y C5,15-methyltransferase (decarboxylating) subunit CbiT [Alkalibacter rhizosphaerae]QSX08822.1 precorrin-6Y C5,15-methyltransferase (decarboxylating) subunit CbiT [Alkalibacter rhizosphaerae]
MKKYYPGIPDEHFERGAVPMTKEEIRAITMSKLRMEDGLVGVDIGAGTGSITVEMALQTPNGKVIAIETNEAAMDLIRKNLSLFRLHNVIPVLGKAPEDLDIVEPVDRIVVGGSKGNLPQIVEWIAGHLKADGIVVGNFIVLENAVMFIQGLKAAGFDCETIQVSVARGRSVGGVTMMEGNNPIYIVTGKLNKEEEIQ